MAALAHQESDRVPLDIGGGISTTMVVEGYDNLKQHLGVAGETRIMHKSFRLAAMDEQVMQYLGSDFRAVSIGRPISRTPPPAPDLEPTLTCEGSPGARPSMATITTTGSSIAALLRMPP